jgi:hypothetical protein
VIAAVHWVVRRLDPERLTRVSGTGFLSPRLGGRDHVISAARLILRRLGPERLFNPYVRNVFPFPAAWRRNRVIAAACLVVIVVASIFLRIEN